MSNPPPSKSPQDAIRRELYLLTLYRVFEAALVCLVMLGWTPAGAQDLAEIRESGVLRHLGVPSARFVNSAA